MADQDISAALQQQVLDAINTGTPLHIRGSGSKSFLGNAAQGMALSVATHRGIIDYDPRELVLTARAGTTLNEIEATLAAANQMLTFEPPHFGAQATLGGTIACNLSGPRRPYAGAARDALLGCKLINGRGEPLQFGGQVMKNVAGYDVSRLMAGAYGTLGVLLEASIKVLPRPAASLTVIHECTVDAAIQRMSQLLSEPMPVDAACYHAGHQYLRLSGSEEGVRHAHRHLGGDVIEKGAPFWHTLREQQLPFFSGDHPLYRVLVKPSTPPLPISGSWLLDWGGAQRWLVSDAPLGYIRERVAAVGGHVSCYRNPPARAESFEPLATPLFNLHQRLKHSFDPRDIFNRGRL
ncbi:MAG TPA: glycolate oxidase subunit GlcE, partial [Steroidobacteraceae bacterium]|nr:glycolate oxidase subunit GlcE [Steroidobacteraceae bacterium]